ncbi:MAG: 2-phospho-L-lactate transferase [Frankiales bacterium]|nr:2-phospho-L-lactate transferase [Frankiales bacterium]
MRVTVLAGGVGGARFLLGLRELGHDVTVVGNVGDDIWLHGLRVCPDLDTVMYTLGGGIHAEQGWGRSAETFTIKEELTAYGEEAASWFTLGDRDIATHVVRTGLLRAGRTLTEATARLCERWRPGVRLLPSTDEEAETLVALDDGRTVHFQEWWIRLRAATPATGFAFGGRTATAGAAAVDAIRTADVVLLPPSNPVVSVGAILAIPGILDAVRRTAAPVVGLSPIIAGAPVRGHADACLAAVGIETSADGVARGYGARAAGGVLDGWLVDTVDAGTAGDLTADGLPTRAVPLRMTDVAATRAMAEAALELATGLRR